MGNETALTHLSLFTGIGGLDFSAEMAGFQTVEQCEYAPYPTRVLERHWPGVARWKDVRKFTAESFYVRTGYKTVTVQRFGDCGDIRARDVVPHWMDRIKAVGNAVAPLQALPIFEAIAAIERCA